MSNFDQRQEMQALNINQNEVNIEKTEKIEHK